jgi:hypothetical protein
MRYSQHEIERYLLERFDKPGFFLEIGCWDGELISQTAWLERERGWSGLCVDPFPIHFENRICMLCPRAVSATGEPRAFLKVSIDRRYGGDVSYFSGFTDAVKEHWPMIQEHCDYQELMVPTITLKRLWEDYHLPKHIEFLSVDTEGSEMEIFQEIDFTETSFGLIVFEHNAKSDVKEGVGRILTANGYRLIDSLRVDDIYVQHS